MLPLIGGLNDLVTMLVCDRSGDVSLLLFFVAIFVVGLSIVFVLSVRGFKKRKYPRSSRMLSNISAYH